MTSISNKVKHITWIIFPFFVVILVWQIIASLEIFPIYLFPNPALVLKDFLDKIIQGDLQLHIRESLFRLGLGYAVGITSGLAAGIVLSLNQYIRRFFEPLIEFGHAIPGIVWLPLVILWFGIGYKTVVVIIFLVVFFPVFYGTLRGVKTMAVKYDNVAMMCGAKKWQMIAYVLVPGALPSIMNGIRLGAAYGWRGLIVAEFIGATSGIGYMIIDAQAWLRMETVILGAIVIGIIWICIDRVILKTLEAKTIERWGMIRRH